MSAPLVQEWVDKAEADYQGARALQRQRKHPLPDLVCFHCQQSAEKYLKAYLVAHGDTPPRIHDVEELINRCLPYDRTLSALMPHATALNQYSVDYRYPGMSATLASAQDALQAARRIRTVLRKKLGV
jgi:HEPN domain-containing protein